MEKKVIKAGLGYTIGNIALKCISFFTLPIFTRLLTTEEYGLFNTYIAYESILCIFVGLSLNISIKTAKYDFKEEYNKFLSSTLLLEVFSYIGITILLNLAYHLISPWFGFGRVILNILTLHAFGTALISFYNQKISLDYEYKNFLKLSVFNVIGNIILSVVLILFVLEQDGFLGRVLGTVIPIIIISIYILYYFWKKEKATINKKYWKYGLSLSLPLIPHGISQVILASFDRIMIKNMVSDSAAGIYSFSYNIGMLMQVLYNSVETAWVPYLYEKMNAKDYKFIYDKSKIYLSLFTVIASVLLLISPEIVVIMASEEYWEAKSCVFPIILSCYFYFIYCFSANIEYYYKKTKYIPIGTTIAAILNIVLNAIFIPKFGYLAAAYTTLVTYAIYAGFHYFIQSRICREKIYDGKFFILNIIIVIFVTIIANVLLDNIIVRYCIVLISLSIIMFLFKDKIRELLKLIMKKE